LFTKHLQSLASNLIFALALAMASATPTWGLPQIATLDGHITDERNTAIEGALCTLTGSLLPGGGLTVTSDRQGKFRFLQLQPGQYKLECAAQGYRAVEKQIELSDEAPPVLEVVLPAEQILRQRIEVHAQAPTAGTEQASPPQTITAPQMTDLPLAEQKFKAALPLIPGVIRTPDGKINIKGVPENQGLLLLDGAENVDPVTGSFSVDVPLEAIESVQVYKNAYRADYGGFSGGLTTINTKPPSSQWHYEVQDITPNPQIETGTVEGIADFNPRFYVTGPLVAGRLNFSEAVSYDTDKQPVRGLPWPHDLIRSHDFTSFTTFQYVFSARHLTTVQANVFPASREFVDISSLIPQSASSNYGQQGFSVQMTDRYLTSSGTVFTTVAEGMQFDSYAHGQGSQDMLLTPNGWGGNFFNSYARQSNEEQIGETITLPSRAWLGKHDLTVGGNFIQRAFSGSTASRPVQILRSDGTLAEQINFSGSGQLSASDSEGAGFIQDHWSVAEHLALDLGLRSTGQTLGTPLNFAPRFGVVYSPGRSGKTVLRAGTGVFYSHVPLLLGSFTGNPVRQVSYFDAQGLALGSPESFPEFYGDLTNPVAPKLSLSPPDRTPYDWTSSIEADRELTPRLTLRVSALLSRSYREYVLSPLTDLPSGSALVVSPSGGSNYREFESTLRFRLTSEAEWNLSYVNSQARGDLNTLVQVYIPFEAPVIRPDAYANLPSDIPDRLITWGRFPTHVWKIEAGPVIDWHSGFPYSFLDQYQDYAGIPNSQRFPRFFSLDLKLGKEFGLPLPFIRHQRFRGALTVFNLTNHFNPRDVYNNVTSPFFNHFVGLQHRFFDSELDIL
jgi:hypothetical protein